MSPKAICWRNFSELSETWVCTTHCVKTAFNIFTVELVKVSRADFDEAVIWPLLKLRSDQNSSQSRRNLRQEGPNGNTHVSQATFAAEIFQKPKLTDVKWMGQKFHSLTLFPCTLSRPNNEGWQLLGCKVITAEKEKCNWQIGLHVLITSGVYLAYF